MSRISQQLASQIANKLVTEKRIAESESKKAMQEYFTALAEKKIPSAVMEFFKKHSEYIKTTSSIHIDGKGFNRLSVSLTRSIPSVSPNCYYDHVDMNEAEATKGKKYLQAWEKIKNDTDELRAEIEATLLSLRSFSNIQKELPEAAEFLPSQGLTVIVDTASLRKKLKVKN